jgi:hypothetical protein
VFSTAPISLLYLIGIPLAAEIPNWPEVCWIVDTTVNVKSSVEQRFCTLRNGGVIVGGVASYGSMKRSLTYRVCTAQITLIALAAMVYGIAEERRARKEAKKLIQV